MKFDQVKALIKAFLELYPQAEWGFAHIILSDYNLYDTNFDFCEGLYQALPYPQSQMDRATYHFLQLLRVIPEAERCVPEDEDYES
jgi:hypothetical protein